MFIVYTALDAVLITSFYAFPSYLSSQKSLLRSTHTLRDFLNKGGMKGKTQIDLEAYYQIWNTVGERDSQN